MQLPEINEYPQAFAGYVGLVTEADVMAALREQIEIFRELASTMPAERETYSYAPGKWTIRQVVGHVGDGERVFGYRALCISRGDSQSLPGFDENEFVDAANFNATSLAALAEEFILLRSANLRMLEALRPDQWPRSGIANGKTITVRAIAYVMAGHARHHLHVLGSRYAVQAGV